MACLTSGRRESPSRVLLEGLPCKRDQASTATWGARTLFIAAVHASS